jgi:tetratricopeptide (TPR) repeat protein
MSELAQFDRLLEADAKGERTPSLTLTGEPGIGKSRLLYETEWLARQRDWTVLLGSCHRRSGQDPYAPFSDLLARFLSTRPHAQRRRDLAGCSWLVRLLPELLEGAVVPAPTGPLAPEQERRLMFAAVRHFLYNVAGSAGTLLLLDDLQWAGEDTLDLIASLLHGSTTSDHSERPLRLVIAYRDTDLARSDPLPLLTADLASEGLTERLQLTPLARQEASDLFSTLLAGSASPFSLIAEPAVQRMLDCAGGVPFFLVTYAQALRVGVPADGGDSDNYQQETKSGRTTKGSVPWSIAASIRSRVAVLGKEAEELLAVAAVAGGAIHHRALLVAARSDGLTEANSVAAIDAAVQAQLIAESNDGCYAFTHDLVREVILLDLGAARRAMLHRRVATALEAQPNSHRQAPALAWHFSAGEDSKQALPYALLAGDQAEASYAHTEAEKQYRAAVELSRKVGDQACEAEALEKLSTALLRLARYNEALAMCESAYLAYRGLGDIEGEGRVAEGIQRAYSALAMPEKGVTRLRSLLEELCARGLSPIGQARLYSSLASMLTASGWFYGAQEEAASRLSEALAAAERAMTLARAAAHDGVLARALLVRARALSFTGRVGEGLDGFDGLLPLAEACGDLRTLSAGLAHAQELSMYRGDFALSQHYLDRDLALSERLVDPITDASIWQNQAELAYYCGDWTLARSAIARALEIIRTNDLAARKLGTYAQCYASQLHLVAGEQEQADALGAAPLALARERQDMQQLRMASSVLAERDLLAGHAEVVRAYLAPLLERPGLEEAQALFVLPQFAWALLNLGRMSEAEECALHSCARARAGHLRLWLVDGLRILAIVRLRQARWQEACALLSEAIALCHAMPYPYAEAKTLWVYGQLEAARGDLAAARERFTQALAICERLGEGLYRKRIERDLEDLDALSTSRVQAYRSPP